MVLSSANEGKWFLKTWDRKRERALRDRTLYSDSDLDWLDIDSDEGTGAHRDETWEIRTTPLDPRTNDRKRDSRKRPECGD